MVRYRTFQLSFGLFWVHRHYTVPGASGSAREGPEDIERIATSGGDLLDRAAELLGPAVEASQVAQVLVVDR